MTALRAMTAGLRPRMIGALRRMMGANTKKSLCHFHHSIIQARQRHIIHHQRSEP